MSDKFVASNGIKVWRGMFRDFAFDTSSLALEMPGARSKAITEFVLHERDEELGRWRERPDCAAVVYPNGEDALGNRCVRVLYEANGREAVVYENNILRNLFGDAAKNYFISHSQPKPWHKAKPGEVWALLMDGRERWIVCRVTRTGPDFEPVYGDDVYATISRASRWISEAKRIWEVSGVAE